MQLKIVRTFSWKVFEFTYVKVQFFGRNVALGTFLWNYSIFIYILVCLIKNGTFCRTYRVILAKLRLMHVSSPIPVFLLKEQMKAKKKTRNYLGKS
jgi:hypothetical protein